VANPRGKDLTTSQTTMKKKTFPFQKKKTSPKRKKGGEKLSKGGGNKENNVVEFKTKKTVLLLT